MEQTPPLIDRPAPGHYQGRLSTVLGALPIASVHEWSDWQALATRRRAIVHTRRRRTGQLTLPLESVRG
jgi:nicotinic acid mononucleotide adenylyltransferase